MNSFNIILLLILCLFFIHLTINVEGFVPINDLLNIKEETPISDLDHYILNFDKLITTRVNDIPDVKQYYELPYYEKFPYNINGRIIKFIYEKLNDTEYDDDVIKVTKNAYNVYYTDKDTQGFQKCVFNVDITNNTRFFVRTLKLYAIFNKDGTSMDIVSIKVEGIKSDFKFIPSNKNDNISIY